MSALLKTVGIIVKDMVATLAFYRAIGLIMPDGQENEDHIEVPTESGIVLEFLSEALLKQSEPRSISPVGSSLNLQFECSSPSEVDEIFNRLVQEGYEGYTKPWDAVWGQRFARVIDPDRRIVNFYASL